MRRAIITVDLGFGDSGKGATVDAICRQQQVDLVCRYSGGSQAGHNVQLPDGRRHCFSQFGAGTLAGVPTYLDRNVVVELRAMDREAMALQQNFGIEDPYSLLWVHPSCLISTTYHRALNRLREVARGNRRHGSCGHGIGETRRYYLQHGMDSVFVDDLFNPWLREKLQLMQSRLILEAQELINVVPREWQERTYHELFLQSPITEAQLLECGANFFTPCEDEVLEGFETVLFEGAQGVLLDEWHGFHPHTTWSTVTPKHAIEMCQAADCDDITTLGIIRQYSTRHGAGPLPTEDDMMASLVNDVGNPTNDWQGEFRCGPLDLVLLRYAKERVGQLDGLVVNCLDHHLGTHRVCTRYKVQGQRLPAAPPMSLFEQEVLGKLLATAEPVYAAIDQRALLELLSEEIAPVVMTADGPTYEHRQIIQTAGVPALAG